MYFNTIHATSVTFTFCNNVKSKINNTNNITAVLMTTYG